jgi:hypothetical protein
MKPQEDIKRYFKKATLSTNPDRHESIFEKILSAQEQANKNEPATSRINLGRIIMKSPISKIAAAAAIVIACMIGFTMINKTSSIALGDVLKQIELIKAYIYRSDSSSTDSQIFVGGRTIDTSSEINQTIVFSQEYGVKITSELYNTKKELTSLEVYWFPRKKTLVSLNHNEKTYKRLEIDDAKYEKLQEESYNPHLMVKQILECKYESLGRSTIEGIYVEGFHTNDPNYQGGRFKEFPYDIKLWVDIKTQLPVKIEMTSELKGPKGTSKAKIVIDKFQWDVPVEASEFEPVIPDDYTLAPDKTVNEDTAIQGLKLYAELTGNYPENLDLDKLTSKITEILMKDKIPDVKPQGQPIDKELVKKQIKEMEQTISKTVEPIAGAGGFYMLLSLQDKDPAYYGDRITPKDYDQVLMRWKVSDNEYRVIFGSLHAKTVTANVLAELEQNLPEK